MVHKREYRTLSIVINTKALARRRHDLRYDSCSFAFFFFFVPNHFIIVTVCFFTSSRNDYGNKLATNFSSLRMRESKYKKKKNLMRKYLILNSVQDLILHYYTCPHFKLTVHFKMIFKKKKQKYF